MTIVIDSFTSHTTKLGNNGMKIIKTGLIAILVTLSSTAAANTPSVWQQSYSYEAAGDYKNAAKVISELAIRKKNEYALIRYAWLKYMQGKFGESISAYKKAIKANGKSVDARVGIVLPLLAQERWKEVQHYSQQALVIAPDNYQASLYLMSVWEKKRDWEALKKLAKRISKRYPSTADGLVYLARAEWHLGNKESSKKAYQQVLYRYPTNWEANSALKSL